MSIAGGNPSLIIDTLVNNAALGTGLRQAEAQVSQSTANMTMLLDRQMGKFSQQLASTLARGVSALVAVQAADAAIRATSDAFRNNRDIPEAILQSMQQVFSSVPIFGAIQDALIPLGEQIGTSVAEYMYEAVQDIFLGRESIVFSDRGNEELIANRREELARLRQEQARFELSAVETQIGKIAKSGIAEVETSLGTFRTGMGAPQDASRDILTEAQRQVQVLERIESIMREIGTGTGN